jgi:hypothetical protein
VPRQYLVGIVAAAAITAPVTVTPAAAASREAAGEPAPSVSANVRRATHVYRHPRRGSPRLARLRPRTYFGSPEVVLVLGSHTESPGRSWKRVRYPGIGRRIGWVRDFVLKNLIETRALLVIDTRRRRIRLLQAGRPSFGAPIGVGAVGSPTPRGRFYVRERLVPVLAGGIYGPRAYGLSAYSRYRTDWPGGGQVGVHGTNQPGLIPGRISNGCVRLRNPSIRRLDRLLRVGTPVLVH